MSRSYRVGLIGLSGIVTGPPRPAPHPALGQDVVYSHAAAYAAVEGCQVVAVCDVLPERCRAFVEAWGARWPGVRCYDSYQAMLQQEQLDLVSVATPDHLHADPVIAACEAGVRAILCEKPLATSLADARRMLEAIRRAGVVTNVDYTRRWVAEFQDARAALRAGAIGQLRYVTARLGGPRAMLYRNGTHLIDLINFFVDSPPVWVWGELEPGFEHFAQGYAGDGGHRPESEPGAQAVIAYASGVRANYLGFKTGLAEVAVSLVGDEGRIEIDGTGEWLVVPARPGLARRSLALGSLGWRRAYSRTGIAGAVADLIRALETGEPTVSPAEEAFKAVLITEAIVRSHAQGQVPVEVEKLAGIDWLGSNA